MAIRYISSKMRKENGGVDFAVPARGKFDENSFVTYGAPKADFDDNAMKLYDEIRTEQAKVMMAGANKQSAIY